MDLEEMWAYVDGWGRDVVVGSPTGLPDVDWQSLFLV